MIHNYTDIALTVVSIVVSVERLWSMIKPLVSKQSGK